MVRDLRKVMVNSHYQVIFTVPDLSMTSNRYDLSHCYIYLLMQQYCAYLTIGD